MISIKKTATIAGAGYLIIIITGIFAEFFVRSQLVMPGDAASTAGNIRNTGHLFRSSIAADLIMLLFDVVLAWALYVLLKTVNKNLALLAAFFRLVHAAIYGANLLNLFNVLQLVSGENYLAAIDTNLLNAQVLFFLHAHSNGYVVGLIFFGVHCLVLGYLVYISGFIPKILGILLLFAAIGYLADSFSNFLLPSYKEYQEIFMLVVFVPALIGELSLSLWLLFRGNKIPALNTAG